mgnify:FL=1
MSNYIEITLWCQEDKLRALSTALEPSGSSVVKEMEAALEDLYERTLPAAQRTVIAEKLAQEEREEAQERARRAAEAYRVSALWMERGKTSGYWKLTGAWDVLSLARFLRAAIRQSARPCADVFQEKLGEMDHISQYEFEVLQDAHDHNDVHINGVFSVDFSKHHFGFWLPGQGWQVYPFQDISSAAFKASRKNSATKEECLERFFGALEGRPFRTDPLPTEKEA